MATIPLSLMAAVAGVGHIVARMRARATVAFWLKPLPILLFVALALLATPPDPSLGVYRALVVVGLLFSMAGDIFLALPRERFVAGLAGFLLAHLCYIAAFVSQTGTAWQWWSLLPAALYGAIMVRQLWPHVEHSLRVPVVVYMGVILVMGWQAAEFWLARRDDGALLALMGALLFVASDSVLAWDKFRRKLALGPVLVMVTYYAAQWLLALSVG